MIAIGDIHIYVSDFTAALRFWSEGAGLRIVRREEGRFAAFAVLESPDGGSAVRLFGGARPWSPDERPDPGTHPEIHFDIITDCFDDTLVRMLEHGGTRIGQIETFDGLRTVTVADPDGNTFDLVETVPGEKNGDVP